MPQAHATLTLKAILEARQAIGGIDDLVRRAQRATREVRGAVAQAARESGIPISSKKEIRGPQTRDPDTGKMVRGYLGTAFASADSQREAAIKDRAWRKDQANQAAANRIIEASRERLDAHRKRQNRMEQSAAIQGQNLQARYDTERLNRARKIREAQQQFGKERINQLYQENRSNYENFQYEVKKLGVQQRQAVISERQRLSERKQAGGRVSGGLLAAGGVGIGLLGQAGFPLLNIGFASMSAASQLNMGAAGTAGVAGIVALATAAGEGSRALMRLQDVFVQSAESLNLLPRSFKTVRGELEALKATYGVMENISLARKMRERMSFGEENDQLMAVNQFFRNMRTNLENAIVNPSKILSPGRLIGASFQETLSDLKGGVEIMKEARRSFVENNMKYTARWEQPEAMWSRIQAAAASRQPDEQKIFEQQLKVIDQQIKVAEKWSRIADTLQKIFPASGPQNAAEAGAWEAVKAFPWGVFL